MFLQRAKRCSLPISRDAFLLAMQKVASPMIYTKRINLALVAQTIYFEKLKKFLKHDLTETESKLKGDGNVDGILEKKLKSLQGEVNFFSKCVDLLKKSLSRLTMNLISINQEQDEQFLLAI